MKLLKKSLIIFTILMLFVPFFVQATTVNMNLTATDTAVNSVSANTTTQQNNTTNTNVNSVTSSNNNSYTTTSQSTSNSSTQEELDYSVSTPTISSLSQLPESNLGLANVINIILIVIGILLILLGIAILIRLKN
jgi:type IV secretory pathway VirB6-like protein